MKTTTSFEDFVSLGKQAPYVVLCQELEVELTPIQAFQRMENLDPAAVLLEFSPREQPAYAFLGFHPLAELIADGDSVRIRIDKEVEHYSGHPFQHLRLLQQKLRCADHHPLTQLTGGAVGYIGYDAIRYLEAIPDRHHAKKNLAEIDLKFYQTGITFDSKNHKIVISRIVRVEQSNLLACYENGMAVIQNVIERLLESKSANINITPLNSNDDFKSDLDDEQFKIIVNKAKRHIMEGDAFQIVTSRTFKKHYNGKPFDIYHALKRMSPSPYHFYLKSGMATIVGASPEKIVSVKNRLIECVPLAGTRRRSPGESDATIAKNLVSNTKEMAEHTMLVDLARNDIGKVSIPGSVTVTELMQPVSYSHVMHISSTIQGQLAENCDAIDALLSTFPAGTLSGAPKIRAMEIIDAIESSRRNLYGGAIVALDRDGNLDTCIIIRSAIVENNSVSIRAGAGIVHDSAPQAEANETRYKAQSVMSAVRLAEGGLS